MHEGKCFPTQCFWQTKPHILLFGFFWMEGKETSETPCFPSLPSRKAQLPLGFERKKVFFASAKKNVGKNKQKWVSPIWKWLCQSQEEIPECFSLCFSQGKGIFWWVLVTFFFILFPMEVQPTNHPFFLFWTPCRLTKETKKERNWGFPNVSSSEKLLGWRKRHSKACKTAFCLSKGKANLFEKRGILRFHPLLEEKMRKKASFYLGMNEKNSFFFFKHQKTKEKDLYRCFFVENHQQKRNALCEKAFLITVFSNGLRRKAITHDGRIFILQNPLFQILVWIFSSSMWKKVWSDWKEKGFQKKENFGFPERLFDQTGWSKQPLISKGIGKRVSFCKPFHIFFLKERKMKLFWFILSLPFF